MQNALLYPKKWSKISKNFPGRTQHHIKNRFISVVCSELNLKTIEIRNLIKNCALDEIICQTLKCLNLKRKGNISDLNTKNNDPNEKTLSQTEDTENENIESYKKNEYFDENTFFSSKNGFYSADAFINFY